VREWEKVEVEIEIQGRRGKGRRRRTGRDEEKGAVEAEVGGI